MTNEEKILEMLYELQKGQEELKADIADLKEICKIFHCLNNL